MTGSTHDRREHGSRGIVPGEPGLAHTGTIVDDQSGNIVVAHSSLKVRFEKFKNNKLAKAEGNLKTKKKMDPAFFHKQKLCAQLTK
jgi:hypothetical protein